MLVARINEHVCALFLSIAKRNSETRGKAKESNRLSVEATETTMMHINISLPLTQIVMQQKKTYFRTVVSLIVAKRAAKCAHSGVAFPRLNQQDNDPFLLDEPYFLGPTDNPS